MTRYVPIFGSFLLLFYSSIAEARDSCSAAADDFDLSAVMGLIKNENLKDAEALEKKINEDNGINNVDIDKDGKVDYIQVREKRLDDGYAFEFYAIPSSTQNVDDGCVIATLAFSKDASSNQVEIVGTYPVYITDYDAYHYYWYEPYPYCSPYFAGPCVGGWPFFVGWVFWPTRPLFWYRPFYLGPRFGWRHVLYGHGLIGRRAAYYHGWRGGAFRPGVRPRSYVSHGNVNHFQNHAVRPSAPHSFGGGGAYHGGGAFHGGGGGFHGGGGFRGGGGFHGGGGRHR